MLIAIILVVIVAYFYFNHKKNKRTQLSGEWYGISYQDTIGDVKYGDYGTIRFNSDGRVVVQDGATCLAGKYQNTIGKYFNILGTAYKIFDSQGACVAMCHHCEPYNKTAKVIYENIKDGTYKVYVRKSDKDAFKLDSADKDFRGFGWGASREDVKAIELLDFGKSVFEGNILYKSYLLGHDCELEYRFTSDNELVGIGQSLEEEKADKALKIFYSVLDTITERYGKKPEGGMYEIKVGGHYSLRDFSGICHAINMGYVGYRYKWIIAQRTYLQVSIEKRGLNPTIEIGLWKIKQD